ncbi:regulatory protein, luxR family [Marivirga sericea]|uniref:Regulatory protein, luxR family n=1 Tax=Marivirga sericea TaxID=1028 RepID=A0A1X7L6A9_9BACT|nr:helix-turn-helix transcriptional regulator [Marivirga sericea]SMG49265.1 regulatory protein, luxR family [Marivirga sericea]
MSKIIKSTLVVLLLIFCSQNKAFSQNAGQISGKLILDDSWERKIYVSYITTFEKEYAVSNDLIITSAIIDSLGNFKIDLNKTPTKWSLLRLHVVKKGITPNSLVIGSSNENFIFLVAKRDSEIEIFNTEDIPIFSNTRIEGASYMSTFDYIKKLANYPNIIDYDNSLIEKEFIREVVSEKLKVVADTCNNPLVSLYAIYQTDFQSDYLENPKYYQSFLLKWKNENSSYFSSFQQKFPAENHPLFTVNNTKYFVFVVSFIGLLAISVLLYFKKKSQKVEQLSIQERKIFDLIRNGLSNKEISAECNIELTTVKSHVSSIYAKLQLKSRKDAINFKTKSL